MDTTDFVVMIGSVVIGIGVIFAIYKLGQARKSKQREKVIESLQKVKERFLKGTILNDSIYRDAWQYGFDNFAITTDRISEAAALCSHSSFVEKELATAMVDLNEKVKEIWAFKDNYNCFAFGKSESAMAIQKEWPDLNKANNAFSDAKPIFEKCHRLLDEFLSKNLTSSHHK